VEQKAKASECGPVRPLCGLNEG